MLKVYLFWNVADQDGGKFTTAEIYNCRERFRDWSMNGEHLHQYFSDSLLAFENETLYRVGIQSDSCDELFGNTAIHAVPGPEPRRAHIDLNQLQVEQIDRAQFFIKPSE